jgi:hypothetical protein
MSSDMFLGLWGCVGLILISLLVKKMNYVTSRLTVKSYKINGCTEIFSICTAYLFFYTDVLFINGQAIKGVSIYTACDLIYWIVAYPVSSYNVSYRVSEDIKK